ncbi:ring 3-like [Octopus vulgaris]|uniref:Ring 3-like n=1 Tax=Octopus vulgaris TaxID=6645 RepID=A0AA36BMJ8_OCTVU|nr:ring 3-like [Octopus vulgaris]
MQTAVLLITKDIQLENHSLLFWIVSVTIVSVSSMDPGNVLQIDQNMCVETEHDHIPQDHSPQTAPRNEGNIGSIIVVSQSEIRYCMVNNERYNLGSRFSFTEGCFKYTCMCFRNGSWECPGSDSQYICHRDTDWANIPVSSKRFYVIQQRDTDSCFANNQRYPVGEPFSFVLDCFRYNCQCFHNGSWECPADKSQYVCQDRTRPHPTRPQPTLPPSHEVFQQSVVLNIGQTLSSCVANGQEYPLNKPFTFTDNCYRYVCMCHSNGSWECPGERAEYSCPQTPSQEPKKMPSRNMYVVVNDDPESCYVKGRKYTLGRPFSFEYGCFEYECNCNTDGSWECLSENTKNICGKPREELPYPSTSRPKISQRSVVVKTVSSIRYCSVNGNEFPLGTDFTFTDGCFRYQCECYHNGSWQCPGDDAEYVCGDQSEKEKKKASTRTTYIVVSDDPMACVVEGKRYVLGRPFSFERGCFEYNCDCNRDGSWECSSQKSEYICDHDGNRKQEHTTECHDCVVRGKIISSGRRFSFEDGCLEFHCHCRCDGSYYCPASQTVSKCSTCQNCTVDGMKYAGGIGFKRRIDCEAISCFCHCNGTYICYPEQTMQLPCNTDIAHTGTPKPTQSVPYTLSGTLKPIKGPDHPVVGGISQSYVSPTPPSLGTVSPPHKEANKVDLSLINETEVHHDIEVKADSSIAIQGARLVHSKNETQLKFGNGTFSIHRTISTSDNDTVLTTNSDTCQICHVYSKVHRGNTQFRFIEGCYEYLCNCYCDGSWTCPDNLSVNTCKKKKLTCVVDGRSYRLNTTFIKQIDSCTEQTCNCNIDGSFHCLEDSVVDVCRQAPACRLCSVRGKIIQPKTNFQLREGCFKYKCQCNCDGGWNCPKETAVNLCKRNNKCIRCNAYGTTAAPNSNFELEKDCIRYQCRCNCDGSWNCPGETAVRICGNKCIRCNAKGTIAEPDSDFILRQDCMKYQCRCNCDGSWNCPREKTLNVCNMDERTGCYYCDVKGDRKNGNSRFELKEGCYRYQCRCNCDGSWNCPAETAVNECPAKCHQCDVRGAKHEPNTRFSLQDGCIKYDCICNCDGGWRCPTGVDTCNTDPETGCHYCDVRGEKKKGHTRFELEENCYKFQCACNCDGSWKCPAATAINICQQNKTTCINCVISGKSYQSNIAFTRDVDCYRYRCFCNCDGSWNCPAESAEFICNEPSRGNCRQCNAKGKVYAGNTEFQHEENCYRYKCKCNCDGSWNCPAENAKYICDASTGNCKQCNAKGKVYAGNTEFQHEENCYRYDCKCNCDGSWNCPAENAKYICGASTGNCKQCDAKGKVYAGNTEFQHEENCYRYKCKCNCDGSWNCPAENAKYICGASTGNCKQCDAKGKVYAGNTEFQHEENCYRYDCKCNCDGSWNCPAENAKYICGASTGNCKQCDAKGKVYAGNTEFQHEENCYRYDCKCNCDGSWNCPAENAKYICGASTGNCKQCDAKGKVYAGNTEFQHEENCYRYDCKCNCDGSWNCPAENAKYICGASTGNCQQCDVKGKVYAGNSEFQYEENCYRYDCKCNCDGSWNCPAENAKYVCGASTGNCQQCDAKGKIIKGNTEFQHEENCYRYQCKCNCDGSWNCPAHNAKYICGEQRENCRQCNAKGRIYAGNTEFHHEENCYRYRCKCNCDGSWNCPAENAEYICGASTGNCQQCDAKGKIVEGNTEFQHEENCYRYDCKCNCDGSWNCPSHNAEYICGDSSIPQSDRSCATCRLGNEVHQENTAVIVNNFCYHYLCHCLCNGTWNCPNDKIINRCSSVNQYPCPGEKKKCLANRVEYSPGISFYQEDNCEKHLCTCQCNGSINCFQRTAMPNCTVNKSPQCKDCIKQGKFYRGNSMFHYQYGCFKYTCSCGCDGEIVCPRDKRVDICAANRDAPTQSPSCRDCRVNNETYKGNTRFTYQRHCMRYQCTCSCDGKWQCPTETAVDTCNNQTQVTVAPLNNTNCRSCFIKHNSYKGNTVFFLNNACYRYRCKCSCDGSWECPTGTAVDICHGLQGQSDRKCTNCNVRGQLYKGGEEFDLLEACFKFKCSCDCEGNWKCPSQQPENVCNHEEPLRETCLQCEVKGKKYPGNQWFTYKQGCRRFQCKCRCNGNWHCPKHLTANVCSVVKDKVKSDGTCRSCIVRGNKYAGDSFFSFDRNCLRFRCSCNCDGTWNCLAGPAIHICTRRRLIGFCKKCYLGEKVIEGNSTFEYDFGCTRYQCKCFCDGKFFCPGDRTQPICGNDSLPDTGVESTKPSNVCQNCTLNDKSFLGNSNFRYTLNCFQYECTCGCDGTWACPPERSINICAKSKLTDCNQCIINGYHYKGNSQFSRQVDCFEYTCTCYCNGSWVCPAEKARYICGDQCQSCLVNGNVYRGESSNVIQKGCKKMECFCSCNGSWSCEVLSDTCIPPSSVRVPQGRCRPCSLHGKIYEGNTWFSRIEGCLEKSCKCNCNGRWTCENDNVKNLCNSNSTTESPSPSSHPPHPPPSTTVLTKTYDARFIGCKVNGTMYYTEHFSFIHKCVLYNCSCKNGKHTCPSKLSSKIC